MGIYHLSETFLTMVDCMNAESGLSVLPVVHEQRSIFVYRQTTLARSAIEAQQRHALTQSVVDPNYTRPGRGSRVG